jgi:maltokinase
LRNWKAVYESGLIEIYRQLPCECLIEERWFADRGNNGTLQLEASLQYRNFAVANENYITLNLYILPGCPGFFYYLPLFLSRTPVPGGKAYLCNREWHIYDGIPTPEYLSLLRELLEESATVAPVPAGPGEIRFQAEPAFGALRFELHGSSSNSLVIVTERYLIKNFRRVFSGRNPELKSGLAFTKLASAYVPRIYGYFSYRRSDEAEYTLGIVQEYIENHGTGWEVWAALVQEERPDPEGKYYQQAFSLGEVLAGMHRELAFIGRREGRRTSFGKGMLVERITRLIATVNTELAAYPDYAATVIQRLRRLTAEVETERNFGAAYPIHGDLHLQQVLATDTGWKVIDFEGEPLKTVAEREISDSPLKDLASMLRSISYRVYTLDQIEPDTWESILQTGLIAGYLAAYRKGGEDFLPQASGLEKMLILFQLERVVYEFVYESKYRPDWLKIPLKGLETLLRTEIGKEREVLK